MASIVIFGGTGYAGSAIAAEALERGLYVSPAGGFGSYAPGEATGQYRVGGDILITDENGKSEISAADLAKAFVDEIENPVHRRERFTVAY
jgi:putative NADH-flavin reductase